MWRQDLKRNAARNGLKGALIAYVTSPGFALMSRARLASWLNARGKAGRLLSRLVWRSTVRNYGCYIAPTARLGAGLCLPHPVGVVIGEGIRRGVLTHRRGVMATRDEQALEAQDKRVELHS